MRVYSLILLICIVCVVCFTQELPIDSLEKPPISPYIEPRVKEIDFSGWDIAWVGGYLPNVIFFDPGKAKLDEAYKPLLAELATRMVQNPDIDCVVRGFYSHEFDGIVSPFAGEELASNRAKAVREALLLAEPQLVLSLEIPESGYEFTETYGDVASIYDLRVELIPSVPNWTSRVLVATETMPYWRRGFRIISKSQGGFLDSILARNPDLLLVFSSGELNASAVERAERIDIVVSRFKKDMKKKDARQIIAVDGGNSEPGEMRIDLRPSFFAPEPLNGRYLWCESPSNDVEPIRLDVSVDTSSEVLAYRIDRDLHRSRIPVDWGMRQPNKMSMIKLSEGKILVIPPRCDFSMLCWGNGGEVERSEWKSVKIDLGKNYSEMAILPIIPFVFNSVKPCCHWESSFPEVISRIQYLCKQDGELTIRINGHSNEREFNADSLAIARADFLWFRLSSALMAVFDMENLDELAKFFENKSVIIEIESQIHSSENQKDITPWANGAMLDLSTERLIPYSTIAILKWEFHSGE
ncbi:hypothetical protein KAH81_03785 [bacterium]|nr:hypothetical protein [bacterium]